ncbi:hypothetical protein Pfo_008297 [Paulownia fortunei]|nr:hypothetical protein Pfo_008297 [Paulownia fortunei]
MAIEKSKILIFGATGYLGKCLIKASISTGHPTYVDIVISALAVPQDLDQLKIISAMKKASNIKLLYMYHLSTFSLEHSYHGMNDIYFVPSKFGNEVDRISKGLPPFQKLLDNKKKIRRATEEAGIPFTYVSTNSFAAYFVDYLLHPQDTSNEVTLTCRSQTTYQWPSFTIWSLLVLRSLYPEHNYTSIDDLLNRCLVNPPKPKLAAFA